jgi:hypothetical protein
MAQMDYDEHQMFVRLAEYCELLEKRIEVLEEIISDKKPQNAACRLYRMNISHMNIEDSQQRMAANKRGSIKLSLYCIKHFSVCFINFLFVKLDIDVRCGVGCPCVT